MAPEVKKRPSIERKSILSSNHRFSGALAVSFREGNRLCWLVGFGGLGAAKELLGGWAPMTGITWLITTHGDRVCTSPKDRVVGPLPNGLFMAYKWGLLILGVTTSFGCDYDPGKVLV